MQQYNPRLTIKLINMKIMRTGIVVLLLLIGSNLVAKDKNRLPINDQMHPITAADIMIKKDLLYDKHTLADVYPYKDTTRSFQWEKIKGDLALLENIEEGHPRWGVLQNYKNENGEAPLVKEHKKDAYNRTADMNDVQRYQAIPLYQLNDTITPVRYAKDGSLVKYLGTEGDFLKIAPAYIGGEWLVPKKYIELLADTITKFKKVIVVDRRNQNIVTLEQEGKNEWLVRSMNPATTGKFAPPYAQRTPLGIFVLQAKRAKMQYLRDGSSEPGGYAPYANRFSAGAYIHGVPVNLPATAPIEYSATLGTTPRSHMCVRNATSHSKFIYEWAPVNESIIFVLE